MRLLALVDHNKQSISEATIGEQGDLLDGLKDLLPDDTVMSRSHI